MRGTASIVAAIVCAALAIAGAIDEDAKAILKLEEVVSPDSHKLVTSSISSPQPGQVLCSNTCKYSHDQSITRGAVCDDGGPGHASSECPLGTDCEDCGERVVTASTIATHRLLQSSPNPVVNGGVPICTCCAAIYWHEGGRICEVVPLWELSDWTCRECSSPADLPRDQLCGKVIPRGSRPNPILLRFCDTIVPSRAQATYNFLATLTGLGIIVPPHEQHHYYGINAYMQPGNAHQVGWYRDPLCGNADVEASPQPSPYVGVNIGSHHVDGLLVVAYPPISPHPPVPPPGEISSSQPPPSAHRMPPPPVVLLQVRVQMVAAVRVEDLTTAWQSQLKAAMANVAGVEISAVALIVSPSLTPSESTLLFVIDLRDASSSSTVAFTLESQLSSAESASRKFNLPITARPSIATLGPPPPPAPAATSRDNDGDVVIALGVIVAVLGVIVLYMWRRSGGGAVVAQPVTRGYGQRGGDVTISRTNCNSYPVNETLYGYNLDRNSAAQGKNEQPIALPMFFDKL